MPVENAAAEDDEGAAEGAEPLDAHGAAQEDNAAAEDDAGAAEAKQRKRKVSAISVLSQRLRQLTPYVSGCKV